MSDRIVCLCKCDPKDGFLWGDGCESVICKDCNQPVQAINIDKLLDENEKLREFVFEVYDTARQEGFTDRLDWEWRAGSLLSANEQREG